MNGIVNPEDIEKKIILILRILNNLQTPVGARLIARHMQDYGIALSERTVRYHLKMMDERGLTKLIGRHDGRVITQMGIDELNNARVRDKIGLAIARIEVLAFKTTLNMAKRKGLLPVNVSFFPKERFDDALETMKPAFEKGLYVSDLVAYAEPGSRLGDILIPEDRIGFATVCSIVVNGVLLKNGIPMDSKFGGIIQLRNGKPLRFVELIYYSGTSVDPSEIFILGKMTSVRNAAEEGKGKILANFREIPAPSRDLVKDILSDLQKVGIHGVLSLGEISEPVCQTPVDLNKVGMILYGGLNPVACAHEAGIEMENYAMSTLIEYEQLRKFGDLMNDGSKGS
ncbi:MAG: DUF128 domain-containing protein [Deltaproteobacteria bacterium]|nr:DUF128 domain-containing protein [Deltaproteobacteria bacterium]